MPNFEIDDYVPQDQPYIPAEATDPNLDTNPYGGSGMLNYGGYTSGQDMSNATEQSTQVAQLGYGASEPVTLEDIAKSIQANVGDHALSWVGGVGNPSAATATLADKQAALASEKMGDGFFSNTLDKLDRGAKWMEGNKKASDVLLGMIGGAYTAQERRDAERIRAQGQVDATNAAGRNRIEEQNNADRLTQEANQRYGASITNRPRLKAAPQQNLTRNDGSRVFKNGKLA